MALKRWHRIGIVAAAMALTAVIMLPPRPVPESDDTGFSARVLAVFTPRYWPRVRQSDIVLSTLSELRARRTALQLADSLLRMVKGPRALRSADGRVVVLYEPSLSADSARVWLGMVERELALSPRTKESWIPLVISLHTTPALPRRIMRAGRVITVPAGSWSTMRFVSWRPEQPACFVTVRLTPNPGESRVDVGRIIRRDRQTEATRTEVMDWCQAFARFGLPGKALRRWIGPSLQRYWFWSEGSLSWVLDRERRHEPLAASDIGGLLMDNDPVWMGCARSGGAQCLKLVGLAADGSMPDDGYNAYMVSMSRRHLVAHLMLADPARFGRFWRSDEATDVALASAYGRPAADVIADWRRSLGGVRAGGPRTPGSALLSSLGWAAVAIGLGLFLAQRREV